MFPGAGLRPSTRPEDPFMSGGAGMPPTPMGGIPMPASDRPIPMPDGQAAMADSIRPMPGSPLVRPPSYAREDILRPRSQPFASTPFNPSMNFAGAGAGMGDPGLFPGRYGTGPPDPYGFDGAGPSRPMSSSPGGGILRRAGAGEALRPGMEKSVGFEAEARLSQSRDAEAMRGEADAG
ncbi:hypothetical protein LTR53_018590, partial [Teratosphaeriaceae sp. CCFEE 6253]